MKYKNELNGLDEVYVLYHWILSHVQLQINIGNNKIIKKKLTPINSTLTKNRENAKKCLRSGRRTNINSELIMISLSLLLPLPHPPARFNVIELRTWCGSTIELSELIDKFLVVAPWHPQPTTTTVDYFRVGESSKRHG